MAEHFIEVKHLKKWFPVQQDFIEALFSRKEKEFVRAVDDVSFHIKRGEVFGLAGESGSGKTTTGRLIIRLLEPTAGHIVLNGQDISHLSEGDLRPLRRRMQIIFQDPYASLNPRMSIGRAIGHPLEIHGISQGEETRQQVLDLLGRVGLTPPDRYYRLYPHQISGGQRQRVVMARALILHPDFIVADEPIAMADVSVRAMLLDMMQRLKDEFNLTYLFITHDLATAKYICDRIAVMYLGQIVELGNIEQVYSNPQHPYTQALLAAVPVPDPRFRRLAPIPKGEIPNPIHPPAGCRFHPRCPRAREICRQEVPPLLPVAGEPGHFTACHMHGSQW